MLNLTCDVQLEGIFQIELYLIAFLNNANDADWLQDAFLTEVMWVNNTDLILSEQTIQKHWKQNDGNTN